MNYELKTSSRTLIALEVYVPLMEVLIRRAICDKDTTCIQDPSHLDHNPK
jgi:hypothetical protein